MLVNVHMIEEIAAIVNGRTDGWFGLKSKIEPFYAGKSLTQLVEQFEAMDDVRFNKRPHYALIFYLSISMVFYDEMEQWAGILSGKQSFEQLLTGMSIVLSGKSKTLRFEAALTTNRYRNPYEYVCLFSGYNYEYEQELRGMFILFRLVDFVDHKRFVLLLEQDASNLFFLSYMTGSSSSLTVEEVTPFLSSDDMLKANGALFLIMANFNHLDSGRHEHVPDEVREIELKRLEKIFGEVDPKRRLSLIVNYMFQEPVFPSFFIRELLGVEIADVRVRLRQQELDNMYKLIRIFPFITELDNRVLGEMFASHLVAWIRDEANPFIWDGVKEGIFEIVSLLSDDTRASIQETLATLRVNLHVTDFDRQIRHEMYLKDEHKMRIIQSFDAVRNKTGDCST